MVRKLQMGVAAPWLEVSLLNNKIWRLADRKPQSFTMIVFYRGGHCSGCQAQLTEIDTEIEEFKSLGVDVIAISGDSKDKAETSKQKWGINNY